MGAKTSSGDFFCCSSRRGDSGGELADVRVASRAEPVAVHLDLGCEIGWSGEGYIAGAHIMIVA